MYMQRFIPFRVKLGAFTGSINGRISLPLLLVTIVVLFIVLNIVDFKSLRFSGVTKLKVVKGHVFEVSSTPVSFNKRPVIRYRYTYKVAGVGTLSGVSYKNRVLRFGTNAVPIEYLIEEPAISRIRGMRSGIISPVFVLFLIPLFGITGFFLFRGIRKVNYILIVLSSGEMTYGKFIDEQATSTRINRQRVMICTFEYAVSGTTYRVRERTHVPELVKDESREKILYNTNDPSQALLFDLLPTRVRDYLNNG